MMEKTVLEDALRRHGYRMTPPRQLVWDVLVRSGEHLTAEEIADRIAALEAGEVNIASVYRALALLEELELVRASRLGAEPTTTWELAHPDEHFHLVCSSCGRIEHHHGQLVHDIERHLAQGHGFEADTVELVVTGRCARCTEAQR